jgi:hypothetical protein
MPKEDWKELFKGMVETAYEKALKDIPDNFKGLSKKEREMLRLQLRIIRRRAIFDVGYSVAVLIGNGFAAAYVPFAGAVGLGASAAGGLILFRRASHVLIRVLSQKS